MGSALPGDDDSSYGAGERQGLRLRLDRGALGAREPAPRPSVTFACARRHVPTSSPPTSTAPGQTRGVQSVAATLRRRARAARGPRPSRSEKASPLGRSRAAAPGGGGLAVSSGSSAARIHASPIGVRTGGQRRARARRRPRRRGPAGSPPSPPKAAGVVGPNTCRYRRASSRRASRDRRGWRDRPDRGLPGAVPAHEDPAGQRGIAERVGRNAERASRLAVGHPAAGEEGIQAIGRLLGRRRRSPSSGSLPERERRRDRAAATTNALKRGPHTCTSDGSSQVDGTVPSTRAWIDSSAARGMLSWSPAQAAAAATRAPGAAARRARRPPGGTRGSAPGRSPADGQSRERSP